MTLKNLFIKVVIDYMKVVIDYMKLALTAKLQKHNLYSFLGCISFFLFLFEKKEKKKIRYILHIQILKDGFGVVE